MLCFPSKKKIKLFLQNTFRKTTLTRLRLKTGDVSRKKFLEGEEA